MKPMSIDRRLLLQGGLGALLGLSSHGALADVLVLDNAPPVVGDGLKSAQLRLGDMLIRYLASHQDAGAKKSADAPMSFIVSPASLAATLGFVDLGGNRLMHAAIHRTLGFKQVDRRKADSDLKALRQSVSGIIKQSDRNGPLLLANLLAFDRVVRPKQLGMFGLSGAGADVLVDNLSKPEIVDRINAWVKDKTHDLIPSVIGEAPETFGLVAVNALYFKDKWAVPFEPSRTKREPFQTSAGRSIDVDMMHSKVGKFQFRSDDRFIAVELPYANENFKLVVVTTKTDAAKPQDFATTAGWLDGQGFTPQTGEIGLPKMTLSADAQLLPALDSFGLDQARRSTEALEGFSDEPLQIARIFQRLELRVNEEGTEGAAATVVVTTRSLAPDHIRMIVDKPFMFALRDEKTGLVLFMGYVGSPQTKTAVEG